MNIVNKQWWFHGPSGSSYTAGDNTSMYQQFFTNQYESEDLADVGYTPADESVDVWMDLSAVTASNIPDSDDYLSGVPNSGTGADLFINTSTARPLYQHIVPDVIRPNFNGINAVFDEWYSERPTMQIVAGDRMQITPVNENPTYLEGFLAITPNDPINGNKIIFSHRSESTRLIQIGFDNDSADRYYYLQMRGSGNSLQTITVTQQTKRLSYVDIIYFKFDVVNDSFVLSLNNQTPVTSSYNFGSETFNATIQALGAFTINGSTFTDGLAAYYHEFIMKYSAISDVDSMRRYLFKKYKKDGN